MTDQSVVAPIKTKRPPGFTPGNKHAVGHHGGNGQKTSRMITQRLIAALSDEVELTVKDGATPKKVQRIVVLVERLMGLAIDDGNLEAIKYIFDRVDGKMVQPLALPMPAEGDGAGPYEFTLRLGHRDIDGNETATEVRLRPAVDVPEAAGGDIQPPRHNGKAGEDRAH